MVPGPEPLALPKNLSTTQKCSPHTDLWTQIHISARSWVIVCTWEAERHWWNYTSRVTRRKGPLLRGFPHHKAAVCRGNPHDEASLGSLNANLPWIEELRLPAASGQEPAQWNLKRLDQGRMSTDTSPCSTAGESDSFWPQTPNYQKKGANVGKSQWPPLSLVSHHVPCLYLQPSNNSAHWVLLSWFYRWGNRGSEELKSQASNPTAWMLELSWTGSESGCPQLSTRVQWIPSLTPASVSIRGFPGGSDGKESACNARELCSLPESGRSSGEGNGNPLQYSCLENPKDRETWRATAHGVIESRTGLNRLILLCH